MDSSDGNEYNVSLPTSVGEKRRHMKKKTRGLPTSNIPVVVESQSLPIKALQVSPSVQRCLEILQRALSDTDKFASLLSVTKLVKAEELDVACQRLLLDAISLDFLARVLRTDETPDGCPPHMFKSIALTVLTSFLPCCIGNTSFYALIPQFTEIITEAESCEDLGVIRDAYSCLKCLATDKNGRKALSDFEALGQLVDAYLGEKYDHEQALEVVLLVASAEGSATWDDEPEAFGKLMHRLTVDFAAEQGEQKFALCDSLTILLHSKPSGNDSVLSTASLMAENDGDWKEYLHRGLSDILMSKLGRDQRDKGLRLAGAALECLGIPWVLDTGGASAKGRQFFLIMVHLSCIEVRMSLEDKTSAEALAASVPTTACYSVLEIAINFLVCGALELEQKQKQQLYAALKGAFAAVLTFLHSVSAAGVHMEDGDRPAHLFVCATIRVLGAWLAEETAANRDEVYQALPFVMQVAQHNFEWNNISDSNSKGMFKGKRGAAAKAVPTVDVREQVPDVLQFLLPGLCHLTAEDQPRHMLLDFGIEQLLFDYLTCQWFSVQPIFLNPSTEWDESEMNREQVASTVTSMSTLCNIFMNIVVQEPERVKTDHHGFYYAFLKFIFNKVPEVPVDDKDYLHLTGNMSILGLMILRHQFQNVKSTDFAIFRFVQATVRFLWDAHNIEESHDYATLVVSAPYLPHWSDLMDLWFLGIHTLSLLLPSISWLCAFLLESDWPQTILATLTAVREGGIDSGLMAAFEDLLCLLAKSSRTAYDVMKDRGVELVCQSHHLEDLSLVFGVPK